MAVANIPLMHAFSSGADYSTGAHGIGPVSVIAAASGHEERLRVSQVLECCYGVHMRKISALSGFDSACGQQWYVTRAHLDCRHMTYDLERH